MTKDIRVELRVRNNRVLARMEELGITTVAQLCKMGGIPGKQGQVGAIINLRISPLRKDGTWRGVVEKIAEVLECTPTDLFPETLTDVELETNRAHLETNLSELQMLTSSLRILAGGQEHNLSPEELLRRGELAAAIQGQLAALRPRHALVLRLRFGLDNEGERTLGEVASVLGVTVERVRQMQVKAVRQLRLPQRAGRLRAFR